MRTEPLSLDDVETICDGISSGAVTLSEVGQLARWAKKLIPSMRMLLAEYDNGICDPRTSDELARKIDTP